MAVRGFVEAIRFCVRLGGKADDLDFENTGEEKQLSAKFVKDSANNFINLIISLFKVVSLSLMKLGF